MIIFDFKVGRLLGDIGVGMVASLRVSQLEVLNSQLIQLRSLKF